MLFEIRGDKKYCDAVQKEVTEALGISAEGYGFKWPLPNLKLTTEKDFWGWRSTYSFKAEVWAGQHKIGNEWAQILLYYYGHSSFIDGGFAVCVFREYRKERVEYYTWMKCDHVFKSKNIGNCLNRYTCEKCHKSYDVDSSG